MPKIQNNKLAASIEQIVGKIFSIRGRKAMLDRDIAELYGVKSIALRQQVKRNLDRFPSDFMFQLTEHETEVLVSQNVMPYKRKSQGQRLGLDRRRRSCELSVIKSPPTLHVK